MAVAWRINIFQSIRNQHFQSRLSRSSSRTRWMKGDWLYISNKSGATGIPVVAFLYCRFWHKPERE
ncbi:hypothetical protein [Xenorhabdus hominickii]|uniref:hypothetical protein n=1 Tax=Xenorhabdus hominickii TaxID=351679 RepID=UPI0012EEBC9B|nr:hypothetical protein [Xenorhabdus hominickii]